ncbi:MAG: AAA family ATPase [SAR202 cluster bacterium]|nr:AAA family ATPase [SAR202 cluster bacterium]
MPSERIQRQIDRLLDETEEAISSQDWTLVAERARSVLRLDPENQDALSYLAAAERDSGSPTRPAQPAQPIHTAGPVAADSGRERLEQYIPKELLAKLEGARRAGAASGERRVVTMLFCDVTGSTAAAERLDPEEWAEIMNGAFKHLISPIYRYEGTVARLMGDAILAFFGAPIAHEDDPQRAVLAGLDIIEGIHAYQAEVKSKWNLDFGVRVGINTGLVVVGEVGSDLRVEYTAMGDAINLAARMEQTAQPGTVHISGDTHSLIAPLFDFDAPEEVGVKGKTAPVTAYRVLSKKAEPGRMRGIEGLSSPLVGRVKEINELRQVLNRLHDGRGALVCLTGEAGLGKSSLLNELHACWEQIAGSAAPWIECRGVSYDTTRPYGLFSQQMLQVFGVADNDSIETVRAKVAVAPVGFPPEIQSAVVKAMSVLLAFETASDGKQSQGEAAQRELHEACHGWWRAVASHSPTVIVMDDLHWADPASVQLIIDLFPLIEEAPLLILCSFRPERQSAAWRAKQAAETGYSHVYTEINLTALTDEDSDELFENLLGISNLPTQLRRTILQKTDGNPFFIEEFIRTLIDSGVITRDETGAHWQADTNVDAISIPDNLLALLTARIDRLEEDERRTLQKSSVIGRSFHLGVLEEICEPGNTLARHLNTLQRAELIREATRVPELEYIFQHDLTREAAYNSILLRERREFHLNVGEAVERLFSDRLEENAHLLAHHFYQAGSNERALKYSILAGDKSARLYANNEAITHYTRAIEMAQEAGSSNEQLIALFMARGRAQEVSGQHDEALAGYRELEDLGRKAQDAALEMAALIPMVTIHSTLSGRPDAARARTLSERSLILAQQLGDHPSEAKILWNSLLIEVLAGDDFYKALEFGERSLQIARQYNLKDQIAFSLQDIARAHVAVEQFPAAKVALEGARAHWRSIGNMTMLADNLYNTAGVLYAQGDFAEASEFGQDGLDISRSIGSVHLEVIGLVISVQSHMNSGDIASALAATENGIEKLSEIVDAGIVTEFLHATAAAIYALLSMSESALDKALLATNMLNSEQSWRFRTPMALAYVYTGRLPEAAESLQFLYEQPELESKRQLEYFGILTSLPDVVRGELLLAKKEFQLVLDYDIKSHGQAGELSADIVLPDLLRIRGQALIALDRIDEAREELGKAREIAEARGSRLTLWRILFELSQVAALEDRQEDKEQLLRQCRELIGYIADHCGRPEVREGFLNHPAVRKALASD